MNALDTLKKYSTVVADTSDFLLLKSYQPQDATTNPSLILKAVTQGEYRPLLNQIVHKHRTQTADQIIDHLLVTIGCEILSIIPGRVSTEVDARLSFNTLATVEKAHTLIALYEKLGVARERVLIKIASTWEGIRAAEILERSGINCNMTLLFSLSQAVACAEAGVKLISPFVGRIDDWYQQKAKMQVNKAEEARDTNLAGPGVESVRRIYDYYKQFGYATEIMAASFRSTAQIMALAGCDLLTISPSLLQELQDSSRTFARKLLPQAANETVEQIQLDEPTFRYQLNQDAMTTEKLAEGIRQFVADTLRLEALVNQQKSVE